MATATYEVTGMTCDHCVATIKGEFKKFDGVTDVSVDLGSGKVDVTSDQPIDVEALRSAITDAGFELRV